MHSYYEALNKRSEIRIAESNSIDIADERVCSSEEQPSQDAAVKEFVKLEMGPGGVGRGAARFSLLEVTLERRRYKLTCP